MEFTKEKTNITKGFAICLMFLNHLYAFPYRILHGNYYIPLIPSFNAEFYIGGFGSVCVSIFLFISGYGMFLGYTHSNKNSLQYSFNKLKDFYFTYWIYFLIFVPIGLIFFKDTTIWNSNEVRYSEDLLTLLEGISGWSARYNSEWWFVRMFVLLLFFISPLYINLGKQKPFLLSFISISLFLVSKILKVDYVGVLSVFFWQIMFAVGILCARSKFFTSNFIIYFKSSKIILLILSILFFIIGRFRFGAQIDFLFIPIFIYLAIRIIEMLRLSKILAYIGEYSFPLWLVHSFFCYYYFQDFIYFPRWSPLIFILLLSSSLLSVVAIEKFRLYLQSKLKLQS